MIIASRRRILQLCLVGSSAGVSGCNINISRGDGDQGDPGPVLDIFPKIVKTESAWQMTVQVRNSTDNDFSIHDVTVIAFSEQGEEVCRVEMGDFPQGGRFEGTETIDCEEFPAIVTATAEEAPCEGANIQILYWTGTDEQRGKEVPDGTFVWGTTFRECEEDLPPDRVIANVGTSASVNQEN